MTSFLSEFKHLEVPLEKIVSATNNFDVSNVIGAGGFGKVYKGELLQSGRLTMVAFRRLDRKYGQGEPEFYKEVRMLSRYRHENLISLLGFCKENGEMILVYEYASNGSLDKRLSSPDLSWNQRLRICIGAARGLEFLHDPNGTQQRVLHRNVKSANILLDQNLTAKVSSLGLSKISPANKKYTFHVTRPVGTPGYCDPLYRDTHQLTIESDVYSFGVVLFEVLCGSLCFEFSNGHIKVRVPFWKKSYEQNKLEEIISKDIPGQISPDCLERFSSIAYQCLHQAREQRPTMALILEYLKVALELQIAYTTPKVITATLEGRSSSLPSTDDLKYDVYLSFRGTETRPFVDHLYKALEDANLVTYSDDKNIQKGVDVAVELQSAIKASRVSVIVLSKNYATSRWCLNEMALILEQHRDLDHIVIPIFYHVKHKDVLEDYKKNMAAKTKTETWKKVLTEVADLKGGHYVHDRPETENIEEIVVDVCHQLGATRRRNLPDLIGMKDQVDFISLWSKDESSHRAGILTILGMGGIGKTTLARYVYVLHSHEFDRSSFMEDISRTMMRSEQSYKLLKMQKQLFSQISEESSVQVNNVFDYTAKIKKALQGKKVLVILDDVDSLDHLNVLLGDEVFHPGSKIIITTRDASLTNRYLLFNPLVQPKHTTLSLKGLDDTSSLQLFCSSAFSLAGPTKDYEQVCKKIVTYCKGHPLALKVMGSFLRGRGVAEWEGYIEKLKHKPDSSIQKALQVTYESLPYRNDKELFLHIACFFVEMDRDVTETILDACDIITVRGISTLIDRSLLTIGPTNKLMMHPLLQEMGRDVVRQESPNNPGNRSRLCCHEESLKVLRQKEGSANLLGLTLDLKQEEEKLHELVEIETDAFRKMENLMLLQLNYVKLEGSYENFPEELRWLCMHGFPSKSVPSDLPMESLVALDLSYSKIEVFDMSSNDERFLGSLKILNLSFCEQLYAVGGFVVLPALENFNVSNCTGLIKVSESIEHCVELVTIDLSYCSQLEALPRNLEKLKKLKTLLLDGCSLVDPRPK